MRQAGLPAVAALVRARLGELPVGPTLLATGAGVSTLGNRHAASPSGRRARAVRAGPFVPVGAALRAQSPAVGAAQGRHGTGENRGLAHLLGQVEVSPI